MLKKIYFYLNLAWRSIFYGMSGADKIIRGPASSNNEVEILQQRNGGGVFADMLEEKQTQEVKETVDAYYRIYKESKYWDTSKITIIGEDENGIIFGETDRLTKKRKEDFMKHPPVFNPDDIQIKTIQDNKHLEDRYSTSTELYTYQTTLKLIRDDFTPRFPIEKLVKKMVVRIPDEKHVLVDLYLPSEASQFGKIDAIIISNLHSLKENKIYKSDLTDIIGIEWYSDKAWNTDDSCFFKFDVSSLVGINIFDGSFVLTYICKIVNNGTDLTLKHRTKELDEKYKIEAPKHDAVDIFAYSRHLKRKSENKNEKEIDLNNITNKKIIIE